MTRREWASSFYSMYFQPLRPNTDGECYVRCPLHGDENESMSVNVFDGRWHCFVPDCPAYETSQGGGGDEYDFYIIYEKVVNGRNVKYGTAKDELTSQLGVRPERQEITPEERQIRREQRSHLSDRLINMWHDMLLHQAPGVMDFLLNKRGITKETIAKFKMGWEIGRITIPIYDENGKLVNARRYDPDATGKDKMVSYPGHGDAILFPFTNLQAQDLLLCEGEMDCILACQMGFNAVTCTGGAGTWSEEWNELFVGKNVYVCYDVDDAGISGSNKIARKLLPVVNLVKIIHLPITDIKGADITDYFISLGHTKEDFDRLIERTPIFKPVVEQKVEDSEEHEVHLSQASNAENNGKHIRMNVIVAGKDLAPYMIPKKMQITCTPETKKCMFCQVGQNQGSLVVDIPSQDRTILQLIDVNDGKQAAILKEVCGIPKSCAAYNLDIIESQNVEEITLIPELDFSSQEHEYVVRKAYYVNHGLAANSSYVMHGLTLPDPWSQYSTHLIERAEPAQDNIATFKMTPDKYQRLSVFQANDVKVKFEEIHDDFTHNITHIYGRNDVLTAIDLVYHSVLAFNFQKKLISRGWVECLIMGDTRTGKSESVHGLMNHYKLGELVTAENTSYAGLIGGMQQSQKRWSITWGKIPLNDRRLVVIDEASGLSLDAIGNMSGVRSSGVAEITKIQTERTHARTRLIWISNTRDGRPLNQFGFGVEAIYDLIGKSEDIARFEFVVTCASEEVPMELINQRLERHGHVPHKYTYDLCKDLVLWAWSRKPEQIIITEDAEDTILTRATEMARAYSSQIPIVEGANQRIKLARLAISAACRVFSTDETGELVIVKPEHVEFAFNYLNQISRKPSLGYWSFSKQIIDLQQTAEKAKDLVLKFLNLTPQLGKLFIMQNYVNGHMIEDYCDLDRPSARRCIQLLTKNGMIKQNTHGYTKTPPFVTMLRDWAESRGGDDDGGADNSDAVQ